jgi:hypothetical protein
MPVLGAPIMNNQELTVARPRVATPGGPGGRVERLRPIRALRFETREKDRESSPDISMNSNSLLTWDQ